MKTYHCRWWCINWYLYPVLKYFAITTKVFFLAWNIKFVVQTVFIHPKLCAASSNLGLAVLAAATILTCRNNNASWLACWSGSDPWSWPLALHNMFLILCIPYLSCTPPPFSLILHILMHFIIYIIIILFILQLHHAFYYYYYIFD